MESKSESRTLFEEMGYKKGFKIIAGTDEAGRGPLAGPVVAAACIFPRHLIVEEIKDSKLLTVEKREELYHFLVNYPQIDFGIGIVENDRIDEINILQASLEAMEIAVKQLKTNPDYLLVDGVQLPKTEILSKGIIKGDKQSQSIGAASILAKYTRDQIMIKHHGKWPQYGFDQHKGYGTKKHLEALTKHGPCPIHRRSFEPIKSMLR
jgi:ribonuclease HII